MPKVYEFDELAQLWKKLSEVKGTVKLEQNFRPVIQKEIIENVLESLNNDVSDKFLKIAMELLFHLARYGSSEEIIRNAFDTLVMLKDLAFEKSFLLQIKLFNEIKSFLALNSTMQIDLSEEAEAELISFLKSKDKHVREYATLHLIDLKDDFAKNKNAFFADDGIYLLLLQNICEMILTGPKIYKYAEKVIDSNNLFVTFVNIYVYGKLGLESKDVSFEIKQKILNVLDNLVEFNGGAKVSADNLHYQEHIKQASGKSLIKFADHILKDQNLSDIELVNRLIEILDKIKSKKLAKSLEKINKQLKEL